VITILPGCSLDFERAVRSTIWEYLGDYGFLLAGVQAAANEVVCMDATQLCGSVTPCSWHIKDLSPGEVEAGMKEACAQAPQ
jgi:hypothetical protein